MKSKKYKHISGIMGFLLGFFGLKEVLDLIPVSSHSPIFDIPKNILLAQVCYATAIVVLVVFFAVLSNNIKKHGVFIRKNEKLFRFFGLVILLISLISTIIYNYWTNEPSTAPRMLILIGGILIYVSSIFRIGIEMNEEQELTI